MTMLMIAVGAMTVGAAVEFLAARLICDTASSVQRSPYLSSRADMYRQSAADAFEYEAAFWLGLAEQLNWIGRKEVSSISCRDDAS